MSSALHYMSSDGSCRADDLGLPINPYTIGNELLTPLSASANDAGPIVSRERDPPPTDLLPPTGTLRPPVRVHSVLRLVSLPGMVETPRL